MAFALPLLVSRQQQVVDRNNADKLARFVQHRKSRQLRIRHLRRHLAQCIRGGHRLRRTIAVLRQRLAQVCLFRRNHHLSWSQNESTALQHVAEETSVASATRPPRLVLPSFETSLPHPSASHRLAAQIRWCASLAKQSSSPADRHRIPGSDGDPCGSTVPLESIASAAALLRHTTSLKPSAAAESVRYYESTPPPSSPRSAVRRSPPPAPTPCRSKATPPEQSPAAHVPAPPPSRRQS